MTDFFSDPGLVEWPDGPPVIVAAGRDDSAHPSQPHAHARGQLFGAQRGLLTVEVSDAVWLVPSSHAVWLPPHVRHGASSHGPFEGWGAYVAEPLCATLPAAACTIRLSGLLREALLQKNGGAISAAGDGAMGRDRPVCHGQAGVPGVWHQPDLLPLQREAGRGKRPHCRLAGTADE